MKLAVLETTHRRIHLSQAIASLMRRFRVLWVMLSAAFLLSGCVNYDVGVNFQSPHQGEFVQHIKLGEQLTSFSSSQVQDWLDSVEQRARQLEGRTKRLSDKEIVVSIPFYTGAELESKFNEFFNPVKKNYQAQTDADLNLPSLNSHLKVNQNNLLLFIRNKLSFDLDLRSLGVLSSSGTVVVSPGSLFDLEFRLQTPWGARSIESSPNAIKPVIDEGNQLVWKLQPGEINHLEAAFWLPSSLGIGTVGIVLLVVGGFYLKYKRLPGVETQSVQAPTLSKV